MDVVPVGFYLEVDVLVLARKRSETIRIGADIVLTLVDVRGSIARIGIDAPKDILILRGELEPRDRAETIQNVTADA